MAVQSHVDETSPTGSSEEQEAKTSLTPAQPAYWQLMTGTDAIAR
jgi:hypothetical protein